AGAQPAAFRLYVKFYGYPEEIAATVENMQTYDVRSLEFYLDNDINKYLAEIRVGRITQTGGQEQNVLILKRDNIPVIDVEFASTVRSPGGAFISTRCDLKWNADDVIPEDKYAEHTLFTQRDTAPVDGTWVGTSTSFVGPNTPVWPLTFDADCNDRDLFEVVSFTRTDSSWGIRRKWVDIPIERTWKETQDGKTVDAFAVFFGRVKKIYDHFDPALYFYILNCYTCYGSIGEQGTSE
ncbi:MAG: hypothetical protein U0930_23610, partial [Pirellulales bacterium]